MPVARFSRVFACACAVFVATGLGAAAQPCGSSGDADAAGLYPLPEGAEWGFVGRDGEWRLAPEWRQVRPFSEGAAAVETGAGWGLIDRSGDYIVEPGAQDADRVVIAGQDHALSPYKPMSQGCSAATPADGKPHYVSAAGDAWTPPALSDEEVLDLGSFSEGLAWVRVATEGGPKVGWIDTTGDMVIAPEYAHGGDFVDGRAPAAINDGFWGYIDRSGELVFPRKFVLESAGRYGDDLAPVRLGDDVGFMDDSDWALRGLTAGEGSQRDFRAARPFHDGRAAVKPGPVWIDTTGKVAVDPSWNRRISPCSSRMPRFYDGLLPLVVGDGSNICGNPVEVVHEGPGDSRSGPDKMLWALPQERDKLVWLDRAGKVQIDSGGCRRDPGAVPLRVRADDGGLAAGAYSLSMSGEITGTLGPLRADSPCNRSEFEMDGSGATNAGGPWSLSLSGSGRWRDMPIRFTLSINLPAGTGVGTHPVAEFPEDGSVTALQWNSLIQPGPDSPRVPSFYSTGDGELTLSARGEVLSGTFTATMVSSDEPEDTAQITAHFNAIPYTRGPEVVVVEATGAVAALQEEMPDDPLVNFLSPVSATVEGERLTLSLGEFGPNIELELPADHAGPLAAGPDTPATLRFAGFPVTGEGRVVRDDGRLSGEITAAIAGVDQIDGAGRMTVRFAEIPVEGGQ
ncbi:WG repeat-containing protein [Roseovarius sp. SYSU LYC5161]|uniref:WG repeat-containing protein n=1 Tax=Roseovarius halophilus (ex Wu et al. 2025) TaxID=3376060 RepID=UPI0039996F79